MSCRLLILGLTTAFTLATAAPSLADDRDGSRGKRRPLRADTIDDWNDAALDAIRLNKTAPPVASRALAIAHAAIFDAANGIKRKYQPYLVEGRVHRAAPVEIAVASAAHTALSQLFTDTTSRAAFDALLQTHLSGTRNSPAKTAAVNWGQHVAQTILQARSTDGWNVTMPYTGDVTVPGIWRPTISFGGIVRPALLPSWRYVRTFAIASAQQFLPPAPPALNTPQYAEEFHEVRAYGVKTGSLRTAEQTEIAEFWANGAGTATPPGHWNQIARVVGARLSLIDKAMMFAALNVALADAAIACWDCKYTFNYWRPITAIQEAHTDGNDATDADPAWTPLLETPPFPEYTSGHSTFSGAGASVLAYFLGRDNVRFTVGSDFIGKRRTFNSFSQAAEESAWSRLFGGIHFRSGNMNGLQAGYDLGHYVAQKMVVRQRSQHGDDDDEGRGGDSDD